MSRDRLIPALILAGLCAGAAAPAAAHPHEFIDTGVEVLFDPAGLVTALRITRGYDDFSLSRS